MARTDSTHRAKLLAMLLPFLLLGCLPGPMPPDVPGPLELRPASITSLERDCDLELERWRFDVLADGWSGGGRLWMTVAGDYVEQHVVNSRRAAADGSSDELRLELPIVGDWREAVPDSSTAMHCSDDPNGLFALYDLDAETVLACRSWGPDPGIWTEIVDGLPSCEEDAP